MILMLLTTGIPVVALRVQCWTRQAVTRHALTGPTCRSPFPFELQWLCIVPQSLEFLIGARLSTELKPLGREQLSATKSSLKMLHHIHAIDMQLRPECWLSLHCTTVLPVVPSVSW